MVVFSVNDILKHFIEKKSINEDVDQRRNVKHVLTRELFRQWSDPLGMNKPTRCWRYSKERFFCNILYSKFMHWLRVQRKKSPFKYSSLMAVDRNSRGIWNNISYSLCLGNFYYPSTNNCQKLRLHCRVARTLIHVCDSFFFTVSRRRILKSSYSIFPLLATQVAFGFHWVFL